MEELEKRLYSKNPITISNLISKIVSNAEKKYKDGIIKDLPEVKFLKEKFLSDDPLISEISSIAIKQLINDGVLTVESILTDLLSTMNSSKCHLTLINLLGDLLYLQFKKKKKSVYNLSNPQHPFITLIIENPGLSPHILNKLRILEESFGSDVHMIFQPFYLYILCCPLKSSSMYLVKYKLWDFLLHYKCIDTVPREFYYTLLSWFQVQRREDLEIISDQMIDAFQVSIRNDNFLNSELLILWQINILYNLSKHKLNLQPTLTCLQRNLVDRKLLSTDCLLLVLSQVIDTCSPLYLKNIIKLCETLIQQNTPNFYSLQTIKASILQWLASPCILTTDAYESGKHLLKLLEITGDDMQKNIDLKEFFQKYNDQICTDKNIFISVNISLQLERFKREEKELGNWIEAVKNAAPQEFKLDIFNVLCGILLVDHKDPNISINTLEILVKCIQIDVSLSPKLLTLIFYKISNNKHPTFNFALFKSLPKMVILRDNIPKVIATIQAISRGSENLYNVGLSLALDAWRLDNSKCYTYLEDLLVNNPPANKKWERYVLKAFILKELCEKKPELYGKDIIAHLSKILNECNDDNGALPCSIAIEAITFLCRSGVIDIKTTWTTLSPKFKDDFRYPVVKSLCALIQEIPQLSYTESYKELFDEVIQKLWQFVDFGDTQISDVALLSLTTFGLEHICNSLPEKYLEVNTITNLNSVTGRTWINFLIKNNASPAALNFIKKMISDEIDEYLKYVYQSKGPKEPINYSYLPSHSVVRALEEFIKTWVKKYRGSIHDKLHLECLKIFSIEYSKPLPPLDWSFLQELINDANTKEPSIDIASHQVVLSGTARRLVENYIKVVTESPQDEDIKNVYRNLKFLARSIQPMILRPFFEATIWYGINKYNDENESDILMYISEFLKVVLKLPDVQETNKVTIVQVLDSIIFVTNLNSKLFEVLCQTIIASPSDCLKHATNFKVVDNEESFLKTVKIRFALAKNSKMLPLVWLDEVIDVWSTSFSHLKLWNDLALVFQKHNENTDECVPWLLELIGQIQAKIADRCDTSVVSFLFDILIFAVVIFSGYSVFLTEENYQLDELKHCFPQSLATLLDRNYWEACSLQIMEWLYHMNTEESIPKNYRRIFGICMHALKHNEEFDKNQRWLKYLNSCTIFK